jgi:hypothetical protein
VRVRIVTFFILAGIGLADAAPNIPSSELPGRERQRFLESPVDRFTQPPKRTEPLWQWDCEPGKTKGERKPKRRKGC